MLWDGKESYYHHKRNLELESERSVDLRVFGELLLSKPTGTGQENRLKL